MDERLNNKLPDVYTQFDAWLVAQPFWLQDAAYQIYHGIEIDDARISSYIDMCVSQVKKKPFEYKRLSNAEVKAPKRASQISVLWLSNIVGVNALSPEAILEFSSEGVTVVYGLNGTGKSGFMRIFKQLSASPFEEAIRPNVFAKNAGCKPSCLFIIKEGNAERSIVCDLSTNSKDTPLSNCDIFDTQISNEYITKNNNVSYQPFVFSVLTTLANVAGRITKHIDRRIESIPCESILIPKDFVNCTEIDWLTNLSASTVFPVQYSSWTSTQEKSLEETKKHLDTERVASELRLCKTQLLTISSVFEDLSAANSAIHDPKLSIAYKSFSDAKRRLSIAEKLFSETADSYDKVSVNASDWKDLWRAARSYFESILKKGIEDQFGKEGTICPLCHQEICGTIAKRFQSVDEYINGTCSDDYHEAIELLQTFLRSISSREYTAEQIKNRLVDHLDDVGISVVVNAYSAIENSSLSTDIDVSYAQMSKIDVSKAIEVLLDKKSKLKKQIDTLESVLKDDQRIALQEQCRHLTCHKWIFDNKVSIEAAINQLRKREELENAKQYLTTNKITIEANFLADRLITDAYIARFTSELRRLAPRIRVKLEKAPSQKGSTPYRVTIDTDSGIKCKPEEVLSEGEQRIVALSAFFADATGRIEQTPIVIDDPISSLDINYETAATQRIVELATNRQVIVFTHRISMLVGIEEACKKQGVQLKENYIRSASSGKGVPDLEEVYHGNLKNCLNGILARLAEIKELDADSPEYIAAVGRQCQQFRICIERSVEDVLLQNMVRRFDRRIMTQGIVKKISKITAEDCILIDDMMTKYSFIEHSQPADSPPIEIDIGELCQDIEKMKQWIREFNGR